MNFLVMPIFFLSGALFPLKDAPSFIVGIAKFNPLSYGIDGLRATLTSQTHFSVIGDFSILIIVTLALLIIGSYFFERIQA
jgi:ABC-2 type transport system permease protein